MSVVPWGQKIEQVWGVAGVSMDGRIGRAEAKRGQGDSTRFAVGCMDCELFLGFRVNGQEVACVGPGHSLRVRDGELIY